MKNHKPVVAQFRSYFFAKSETFIYNYISNLKHFQPICLAWNFINLDKFPFPEEDLYYLKFRKYSFEWFYYGMIKKCLDRDLLIEKIIKARNAQLIHAHFGPSGVYALKVKRALGIPLITTFYGYDLSKQNLIDKFIKQYNFLFQKGDLFLVEGPYMKSRLMGLGCPEEKIQIQRIAIPVDEITYRVRKPKKPNEKVILIFAGRFTEKKGLIYALKAIRKVREKNREFEFRIIGDGILKSQIEEYIKINNMTDYVKLLGFLDYENYLEEMQKADIFIHPSITASDGDSEGGAPTTILEAQAMGMPVISTYHADIPNIVIPGKSALLSKEKDSKDLATNILYLLENQELWEDMGKTGREFVKKYHDIKKEVYSLEEKYNFLLNSQYE